MAPTTRNQAETNAAAGRNQAEANAAAGGSGATATGEVVTAGTGALTQGDRPSRIKLAPQASLPTNAKELKGTTSARISAIYSVFRMADRQHSTLTKLSLGALIFNSALAIYNSLGDAASVTSVLAVDAALVLLFLCLREFERGGNGRDAKTKAAVWALTALLTAMFASGVAPTIMPLAVGALVLLCLRDADHDRAGEEGGRVNMDGQYCVLAKVAFAALTCNTALDAYDTRRDSDSAALVFVSYTLLGTLTVLFVRAFARGHAGEQGQGQR